MRNDFFPSRSGRRQLRQVEITGHNWRSPEQAVHATIFNNVTLIDGLTPTDFCTSPTNVGQSCTAGARGVWTTEDNWVVGMYAGRNGELVDTFGIENRVWKHEAGHLFGNRDKDDQPGYPADGVMSRGDRVTEADIDDILDGTDNQLIEFPGCDEDIDSIDAKVEQNMSGK